MGVGCSLDDLPCCTKNDASSTGEVVKARPLEYASADSQLAKGEVPTWPAQEWQDDEKDPSPQKGRLSSSQANAADFSEGVEGQETYEDGSSYIGQLANGRRHGNGTWKSAVEQYSGQWVNDQRAGFARSLAGRHGKTAAHMKATSSKASSMARVAWSGTHPTGSCCTKVSTEKT